jgi:hypothetical protein
LIDQAIDVVADMMGVTPRCGAAVSAALKSEAGETPAPQSPQPGATPDMMDTQLESGDFQFHEATRRIDAANALDPSGKELVYSRRMSEWLLRVSPSASVALRLAARGQHLRRWMISRADFPMDRIGYLTWRTTLYKFHAEELGKILREAGYDDATIARVQTLVRKERIKSDAEAQTLEDVICLVFLENYFSEFAAAHDEEKVIGILRKTWKKMSERGHELAMGLAMPQEARRLVQKALLGG